MERASHVSATFEWDNVIDNIPLPAFGIAAVFHKFISPGSTPFDLAVRLAVRVPLSDRRSLRNR